MRVAAIQLQAAIGGADHNLEACCRMPPAANEAGAEVSVLP